MYLGSLAYVSPKKLGHLYWTWSDNYNVFFTKRQLERLHQHFMHPSASKLYNLLRRGYPRYIDTETQKILKEISNECKTCNIYDTRRMHFQVRDKENIRFNQTLLMDIMYLEDQKNRSHPVLHIIDEATHFQAATFLKKCDVQTVWIAFLKIWASIYVGFPESLLVDQGSVFVADEWAFNCESEKIILRHTGTESHNSLGSGETYHSILRRIYNRVKHSNSNISPDICLSLSIRAINCTVGPNGLCPQLLVFGVIPRIPAISKRNFSNQIERLRTLKLAIEEYEKITSKEIVCRGLRKKPSPSADEIFLPGDFAYVYREKLRHFTGPHLIASVEGKNARLHVGDKYGPRSFNISQLKKATINHNECPLQSQNFFNKSTIYHTEIIQEGDVRTALFSDAKRKELDGLIQRGTFKIVIREDIEEESHAPNILPTRFVLAIKHGMDNKLIYKARFVLGGHKDVEKCFQVHSSSNLKMSSIRLILALATILGLSVWNGDVKQSYIQSAALLQRKIFIRPREIELHPNELVQVLLPLYGLTESGEYWYETYSHSHKFDLRMQQATGDFALFFRRCMNRLVALSGTYVDDTLMAATKDQKTFIEETLRKKFDIRFNDTAEFIFAGILCDVGNESQRKLSQKKYIERIQYL